MKYRFTLATLTRFGTNIVFTSSAMHTIHHKLNRGENHVYAERPSEGIFMLSVMLGVVR
jgi:hypothetical protein